MEIPLKFQTLDRIPDGMTSYNHYLDMQVWMLQHCSRIWCFSCLRGGTKYACHCKLKDATGRLAKVHDRVLIPHRGGTSCYYRCHVRHVYDRILRTRYTLSAKRRVVARKACDLYIVETHPINPISKNINISVWLECARRGCNKDFFLPQGLESNICDNWRDCSQPFCLPTCKGPIKWLAAAPLNRLCQAYIPTIVNRLRQLTRVRQEDFAHCLLEGFPSPTAFLDELLLNLYGIAALLNARQTCRAWKKGVAIPKLLTQIQEWYRIRSIEA